MRICPEAVCNAEIRTPDTPAPAGSVATPRIVPVGDAQMVPTAMRSIANGKTQRAEWDCKRDFLVRIVLLFYKEI
jgi:hypothetical protein